MKKLIIMALCVLSAFSATAQNKVQWGIEVGAGLST